MKRTLWWIVGIGCIGIVLSTTAAAKDKAPAQKNKPPVAPNEVPAPQADAAKAPEHVVFTFENDDKMKEFAALWQKRQAMLLRMSVLKSYWEQEQEMLNQLSTSLTTDYHLDLTKSYTLDAPRRLILEREVPDAAVSATPGAAPSPTTPTIP